MRKEGELLICSRCEKAEFIAKDDKRKPEGWDGYHWTPPGWWSEYGRDLCPECSEAYKRLIKEFMESGKVRKEESTR